MKNKTKIVIVGGGFGGFHTARRLVKKGYEVLLINDEDYFTFTPLLVEVATGSLNPGDVSFKYLDYFRRDNFKFVLGKASVIDLESKKVEVNGESIDYDYLVLATGAKKRNLRVDGEKYTFSLKTLGDAIEIKKMITAHANDLSDVSHINVVGAGPTGVELVFGIAQLLTRTNKDNKSILRLFNSRSKLFPFLSDNVRYYIDRVLKSYSINMLSDTSIDLITASEVNTKNEIFRSDVTILAIGVSPNTDIIDGKHLNESGHVVVSDYLQVENYSNVFALGDIITIGETQIPKLAQTASDQAKIVSANIVKSINKKPLKPYKLFLKGELISLGEGRAVGNIMGVMVRGRLSYLLRFFAYVSKMPGFKNKITLARSWFKSLVRSLGY